MRDVRPRVDGRETLPPRQSFGTRHVMFVAARGGERVLTPSFLEPACHEEPNRRPHERDQEDPADELGERELPPEEDPHDDSDLEDEIRRGELKRHHGGEARTFLEQRLRNCDRRVAAGGRRRAETRREQGLTRASSAERALQARARDPRLHDSGEEKAQHERPADLPEHLNRVPETVADPVEERHTP